MAEEEGFEPPRAEPGGFQDRCITELNHCGATSCESKSGRVPYSVHGSSDLAPSGNPPDALVLALASAIAALSEEQRAALWDALEGNCGASG